MRDKPIPARFFTLGRVQKSSVRPQAAKGQGTESPTMARFFTLGSVGKNSFCRKWRGSFGTRLPFREACRYCHNPRQTLPEAIL